MVGWNGTLRITAMEALEFRLNIYLGQKIS